MGDVGQQIPGEQDPVVGSVLALQLHPLRVTLGHPQPDHQVVEGRRQDSFDLFGRLIEGQFRTVDGHGHKRHLKATPRRRPSEGALSNEVGEFVALFDLRCFLGWIRGRARPLVPSHRLPFRDQHASPVEGPEAELKILAAPLAKRRVTAADRVEELTTYAQVATGSNPEQIGVGRGEMIGAPHVELDPLRAGHPPSVPADQPFKA